MNKIEDKLNRWGQVTPSNSYEATSEQLIQSIKHSKISADIPFEIYISGSYRNKTYIGDQSDIDLIIELTSPFSEEYDKNLQDKYYELKSSILKHLIDTYKSFSIQQGNKCIKVTSELFTRLSTDIVVCQTYIDRMGNVGIIFETAGNSNIINYPELHSTNLELKNKNCNYSLKKMIRIFKNIRNFLNETSVLPNSVAPSFFLECLLYNAPDYLYDDNSYKCIRNLLSFYDEASLSDFNFINEIDSLFYRSYHHNSYYWSEDDAQMFLRHLKSYLFSRVI